MEPEDEIHMLRKKIDEIDREIILLLRKRFEAVKGIGLVKKALGTSIEDAEREKEVLENCLEVAGDSLDKDFIREFTHLILKYSKKIQRGMM